MSQIHSFRRNAMATHYEVRIGGQEQDYAAQAAQSAFDLLEQLEGQLSRFRRSSIISQLAQLDPGQRMRLPENVCDCLEIAKNMELATGGAFSISAAALKTQPAPPQWSLLPRESSILCESGRLEFDLGAVGKGFALDRMAALLRDWDCEVFLLVAGGSSILAGAPPENASGQSLAGWSCGLGNDNAPQRILLHHASLSGSGLAVKGSHILDPRTGLAAERQRRAWALADTAAESDALSTACMVLTEDEIMQVLEARPDWLVFLEDEQEDESLARPLGSRPLPPSG